MFNKENCLTEMMSCVNAFSSELKNIRTGRVSPDILKTIVIDSYGSKTPLTQLSNINNLDNMTLNVNIWDSSLLQGWWWWWSPPILIIILVFVSLYLISQGLDEWANPRLKTKF